MTPSTAMRIFTHYLHGNRTPHMAAHVERPASDIPDKDVVEEQIPLYDAGATQLPFSPFQPAGQDEKFGVQLSAQGNGASQA
jgi:hypothetical protein